MSLMKIHRSNESFRWLLLLFFVAVAATKLVEATTAPGTQTNVTNAAATNGAIRQQAEPVQQSTQQQQQQQSKVLVTSVNQKQRKENPSSESQAAEGTNSAEILNAAAGVVDMVAEKPTTYRPTGANRPSIAPHNSAQERERKLMNVLAARRSALHRGGFRTRIGTTGRSATSPAAAAIETTSKSPTDPRSVCIRNCTKNFTRRTTASCMRQCANFTRMAAAAAGTTRSSSKTNGGVGSTGERDTNEILFSDESSHGIFVVAKEQNDTLNHIPDIAKLPITGNVKQRGRGKPAITVTLATTSVEEDDELQPYVYFGSKLPPIKPGALTITAVAGDNEHPRVLEVSVAQDASTTMSTTQTTPKAVQTAATISTRRPLSAVERSRSRYKYHMRERGVSALAASEPPPQPVSRSRYVGSGRPTAGLGESSAELKQSEVDVPKQVVVRRLAAKPLTSSTPLIITVLSAEEETTNAQAEGLPGTTSAITTTSTTEKPTTTTTTKRPNLTKKPATTTTTTTTTSTTTTTTASTTTSTSTNLPPTKPTTTTTSTSTSTSTSTLISSSPAAKRNSIIENETELLRSMGPELTQEIIVEDQKNLIIFCKNTAECGQTTRAQFPHTTDSNSQILRTTVLTSVRSTVHPRTTTQSPEKPVNIFIGVVETSSGDAALGANHATASPATTIDISSTTVNDERDVNLEMRRMNLVTMVLVAVGVVPLAAIILYLVRNYIIRRKAKKAEVFDVCITDQQPISPVKKVDSKYQLDEEEDEVDHHHVHQQSISMSQARDANKNHRYGDDKSSIASEFQEFERSNIRLKSLLGEGNFGQVWKAEADDLSGHFGATRIVAVKTIRACSAQVSLKDEANIMRKLGSHRNVVTLLGACVESEPHMLIMEYAMRGRLLSLLRAARSATNILPASVPGGRSLAPLSPRTLAGFALDIACGMEYISDRRIVHRDLAARNVLLDHNGVCKICDFGMSIDLDAERMRKELEKNAANDIMRSNLHKFKFDFGSRYILQHWQHTFGQGHNGQTHGHCSKEHSEKKSHGHGHDTMGRKHALPIRWMAPEALQLHMFTTETDIWAFGIVLWEIATLGSTPYSQLTGREVIRRVPQGLRPDLPKESRHEFYNLMSRCWHKEAHMRPSFAQSRLEITRSLHKWVDDDSAASDYMDVSGFSEDLEHGVVYFNHRISEFECEI